MAKEFSDASREARQTKQNRQLTGRPQNRNRLKTFGKSPHPVCNLQRGYYAGGWAVPLMEPTFECVETQCKAMGSENCVFELRKRSEFDLKDKEVIRQMALLKKSG
ncbi:TPA: hypothetical protein HA244_04145 [Candidatus Micrarchaeota archaeon]|nr:hypothetical protein [Candidatus Micrarchaeota archaeon]